ncbi:MULTISPECIES: plasmid pRiA4b ORF-3 family protein [Corynebacterium]|uniref:plasmid pRiA4b ORF-3 family protein n=1 Tax=Corynebacterium TaxID=1716 RepID=UPI001EF3D8C5|nr:MULTISPECIES: plasmid pRiA4b ORF-3 family protein [Corynebacterium]MCG7236679.1 plasmid pRiA4b ORF-3 family protein [Corynebacterium sp. ACRQP]
MTVSVLMIVEGTSPEISRCVNVEETMTLGELSQIIDASLGFTGAATHLYVSQEGTQRSVFTAAPGPGEHPESELTVAEMRPMNYVYDPAANWNVHVEVLGPSNIEGPTPMLIDAAGPDVVEACSGPELMTTFRHQARLLAAGIEPDLETITLMFSYLPVMPPERMLDRMTQADPVSVATRIGNVAEEMFFDEVAAADEHGDGPGLAQHFDDFLQSRPDLLQIIDMDPHPERNPTMINAVTEFFGDMLGGPDGVDVPDVPGSFDDSLELTGVVAKLLELFTEGVALEQGILPLSTAQAITHITEIPFADDVSDVLVESGLLKKRSGTVTLTKAGKEYLDSDFRTSFFSVNFRRLFEAVVGREDWDATIEWFIGDGGAAPPESMDFLIPWLYAFSVVEEIQPGRSALTAEGREMMHEHREFYQRGKRYR